MWPSSAQALFFGPALPQTAGAAHHLTADSHGRCDPNLQRTGRPGAALHKSQSQQTGKAPPPPPHTYTHTTTHTHTHSPPTQEDRENNTEEVVVVETRLMNDSRGSRTALPPFCLLPVTERLQSRPVFFPSS